MARIGVMDVDSFFPAQDRFACAMTLNALLASPGFEVWSQGEPLDVAGVLRTQGGKPRVSIFTLAHLDDSQRMFFVALLLNAIAGWMRRQTGTSSLRAMVYMDEIFGFFPPVANPPSKGPLLTLLKQGRAAGVGVVLATQNPVDLDYKGLSNIGTWWLGRLQTERDKARLLDGLQGAQESSGFDRAEVDRLLSALSSRVFLMRNVHEDGLTLFQSRWALSYLRGPLGRDDIKRLTANRRADDPAPSRGVRVSGEAAPVVADERATAARALVPPDVPEYFSPDAAASASTALQPVVYGAAQVRFVDSKVKVDVTRLVTLAAPIVDAPVSLDWQTAERVEWPPEVLEREAPEGARYRPLPTAALKPKNYATWAKGLTASLSVTESLELFRSPSTGEVSRPDETERDFRARLQQTSRETRDRAIDTLRRKYAPRQAALEDKLRRAQQALGRETEQAGGQKLQTAISFGATLVGAFMGRKMISAGTIGRATTAARGVGRSMKEAEDVERARQTVSAVEEQQRQLAEELRTETATIEATSDVATEPLERVIVKAKKTNITPKLVALVWTSPFDQ
jgi:hypothetical protein